MRTICAAVAAITLAACASALAPLGSAADPPPAAVRSCGTRGESDRPQRLPERGGVRIGPLTIWPSVHTSSRSDDPIWRFSTKSPVVLPAKKKLVLAVAPEAQSSAALQDRGGYVWAVRFEACRAGLPAFMYRGTVGKFTGFPFAFALTRKAACVPLEVWLDGRATPLRKTVAIGRRSC